MFKNRGRGRMSAAASLGMLLLWDVEGGLSQIDKYMISEDENIKAGALLAVGIVNSTVRNEHEPALALLTGARRCRHTHSFSCHALPCPAPPRPLLPSHASFPPFFSMQITLRTKSPCIACARTWAWAWRMPAR